MKPELNQSNPILDSSLRSGITLDFETAYAADPAEALSQFLLLLLNREACLDRVALLRSLAGVRPAAEQRPAGATLDAYQDVLNLIAEGRLFDTWSEGRLAVQDVHHLHRLSGDPEALWAAHQVLRAYLATPQDSDTTSDASVVLSSCKTVK